MTLVDTDVLIDYLRGAGPGASWLSRALESSQDLRTSVVSRFELQAGARGDRQREAIAALLQALPSVELDDVAADRAASVRRDLDAAGHRIGMADSLIAGIALAADARLVTRNTRHFGRVPRLRVVAPGE